MFRLLREWLVVLAGLALCAAGASAQSDPPARVGRLSAVSGSVWLLPAGSEDWVQAALNQPVTNGDTLATDPGALAEVDIGSTTLRLGNEAEVSMQQLDDARITAQVERGSLTARLRSREAAMEFSALTPQGRFVPLQTGYYRIDTIDPGSQATAYEGSLRFDGPDSTLIVSTGEHAEFWRDESNPAAPGRTQYTLLEPSQDSFAQWSGERDQQETRIKTPIYVSPDMPGAEDLARYGQWSNSSDYGPLWMPTDVDAGWAPYSVGAWSWVEPWGWTWIDAAPWGFAPFHYGRWVRYRERWCWAPGSYVPRPVYAPALVAWIGGGPPPGGRGHAIGHGPEVGWFPLAPREAFVPGYRASPGYIRGVNAGYARQIPHLDAIARNPHGPGGGQPFVNRHVPGAISVMAGSAFAGARPRGVVHAAPGRDAGRPFAPGGAFANAPVRTSPPIAAPAARAPGQGPSPQGPRFGSRGGPAFPAGGQARDADRGGAPGAVSPGGVGRPGFGRPGEPANAGRPADATQPGFAGRPQPPVHLGQGQPGQEGQRPFTPRTGVQPLPPTVGAQPLPPNVGAQPLPPNVGVQPRPPGVGAQPIQQRPSLTVPEAATAPRPGRPGGPGGAPRIGERGQTRVPEAGANPGSPEPRRYQHQPIPQWQRQELPRPPQAPQGVPQAQPPQMPQPGMPQGQRGFRSPQPQQPQPAPMPQQPQVQPRPQMPMTPQQPQAPQQPFRGGGGGHGRGERGDR